MFNLQFTLVKLIDKNPDYILALIYNQDLFNLKMYIILIKIGLCGL